MLADLFPTTVDQGGILFVMLEFTTIILLVVGIAIFFFARWSKKEKSRRNQDINTTLNLRR